MFKRLTALALTTALLAAACGSDADDTAAVDTTEAMDDEAMEGSGDEVVTGPATLGVADQSGDGTTVTVASVKLPTDGFIVVHADNDGAPGAVIGHSALLPAGDSFDVVVTLDTPLDADATVFPMAHVDANGNGEYEFTPPDDVTDVPATTGPSGDIAVAGLSYTLEAMEEEAVTGPSTITADDQSGDGTTVTVASVSLPTDGFVVVHADNDGAPGPVIGHSDLLPAGDSSDVVITLDTPLDADATVFPMAHIDANGNGEYEFTPPDDVTDVPATTADGAVAVVPVVYTVG